MLKIKTTLSIIHLISAGYMNLFALFKIQNIRVAACICDETLNKLLKLSVSSSGSENA